MPVKYFLIASLMSHIIKEPHFLLFFVHLNCHAFERKRTLPNGPTAIYCYKNILKKTNFHNKSLALACK